VAETKEGSKIFFFKLLFILFLCFLLCSFTFNTQSIFVTVQFAGPMTQKLLNLVKEWGKYWTIFNDKYISSDGAVLPYTITILNVTILKKTMITKLIYVYRNDKNKKSYWMHHTRRNWVFMPIFFSKWVILHGWNKILNDILKMNFIFHEFSWMNFCSSQMALNSHHS
jgi:hypothetical protein